MSKIIIHAGLHKTGTSAIQNALFSSRKYLWKNNCFYPNSKPFTAHHQLAARLNNTKNIETGIKDAARTLMKYNKKAEGRTVIISSEMFCEGFNPEFFSQLFKLFKEIDIVFYVRQQDELFESAYNQQIKQTRESRRIEEYRPYILDIHARLKRFQNAIKGSNVYALEYKPKYWINEDLIDDFIFRVLGLEPEGISLNKNESTINPSLSPVVCAILSRVNQLNITEKQREGLISDLIVEFPNEEYGIYTLIDSKYRAEILSKAKKSNALLKKDYLRNGSMEFDDHSEKIFLDNYLLGKFIKGSKSLNKFESKLNIKFSEF